MIPHGRRLFLGACQLAAAILFAAVGGAGCWGEEKRYAFFVAGDCQYIAEKSRQPNRLDPYCEQASQRFFKLIGELPGSPIPPNLGGGTVSDDILGVIVTGDLIDSADKNGGPYPAMQQFEWTRFKADFGINGEGGKIRFPVYELHGNHDGPQGDTFIIDEIIARNGKRKGLVNISAGGLHYSWDWGPLHCVNAGIFVGLGDVRREGHHYAARASLEFLRGDLAKHVGDSRRPVIVSFHLHPNCPEFDWSREDLAAFWDELKKYNVIALFHGHTHGSPPSRMLWDGKTFAAGLAEGIDVFNPDDAAAAKTDPRDPSQAVGLRHGFLYVELIDRSGTQSDQFIVRSYATKDNWATHQWQTMWSKPIDAGTPSNR
jgi:hypothetical protein